VIYGPNIGNGGKSLWHYYENVLKLNYLVVSID
jgi:hypothetical protein